MGALRQALQALLRPGGAFQEPAAEPRAWGRALGRMLVWRTPVSALLGLLEALAAVRAYQSLRMGNLPDWAGALFLPGLDPDSLHHFLGSLPAPPALRTVALAALALAPLQVLGLWFHHAVWDHTALWLLRGLKARRGFRATLQAEAEALRIASLGVLAGVLGYLPGIGPWLALPLALLDAYLWLFRGFALAAFHEVEPWKGLAATVLHAAMLGCLVLMLALAWIWMVGQAA